MEDKINAEMSISGGTPTSSRWNPTKEQTSMLQGWFRQGIRTPSAEQIQHITTRLKAYGHIQDKNVFYWFQNHKARERQKEKQDRVASINRSLHKADPVFFAHHTPPCGNVVCSSFYLQQSGVNLRVIVPKGVKRTPRTERIEKTKQVGDDAEYKIAHHKHAGGLSEEIINCINNTNQETLVLFPLHPTGVLEERNVEPFPSNSTERFIPSYPSEANHLQDWFKFY